MNRRDLSPRAFHVLGCSVSSDNASQKLKGCEGAFSSLLFSILVPRLSNHPAFLLQISSTPLWPLLQRTLLWAPRKQAASFPSKFTFCRERWIWASCLNVVCIQERCCALQTTAAFRQGANGSSARNFYITPLSLQSDPRSSEIQKAIQMQVIIKSVPC